MNHIDYIPISVATLLPTATVGLNLYQREYDSERLVLYRDAEFPLTMDDLDRLRNRGVRQLYISGASRNSYQHYLRKMATTAQPGDVPLSARAGALNEVVRDILESAFQRDQVNQTINAAGKLGKLAAEIISKDEFATGDLLQVMHHDYATFTHSTNVAFYCGMLAAELGYSRSEIEQITIGGLIHDLGKLSIDDSILSKPARLNEAEFRIVRTHPSVGFRRLVHRDDLNEGQLMMVYQHHERIDGKGYPVGKMAAEIHPWARLCAVVDVFEALTSQRPYRTPMSRPRALALQKRDSGTAFDREILQCWTQLIQNSSNN